MDGFRQCSGAIRPDMPMFNGRCPREGVIEREGGWYCHQCDPDIKKQVELRQRRQAATERILQAAYSFRYSLGDLVNMNGGDADIVALFDELKAAGWRGEGEE